MVNLYQESDKYRYSGDHLDDHHLDNNDEIEFSKVDFRSLWRKDFGRLIHSPAFRRLQGKTQLYPGSETDYFRNRLTHSIEVAQIAKSIAQKINFENHDTVECIDLDLIEFAGLAHDLGHPPFGHQGEEALDDLMIEFGGFEGNAQTLRILTKLEKKFSMDLKTFHEKGKDKRIGLQLCARSIASILKYDYIIPAGVPARTDEANAKNHGKISPIKGYYQTEEHLVEWVKNCVIGNPKGVTFKTIECHIMDIADDIAYSTYDLDDSIKSGFITLKDFVFIEKSLLEKTVTKLKDKYSIAKTEGEIRKLVWEILFSEETVKLFIDNGPKLDNNTFDTLVDLVSNDAGARTKITSVLVDRFIRGVSFELNQDHPALSFAKLNEEDRIVIEFLKTITVQKLISSPRFKIVEHRGKEIVKKIFNTIFHENYEILPEDYRTLYLSAKNYESLKARIVCDFIASMTDRYAIEFYGRLTSERPTTIFKPF